MTHTSGPFEVKEFDDGCDVQILNAVSNTLVGYASPEEVDYETCKANARLMAAAPDMLAILKSINEWWSKGGAPIHRDSLLGDDNTPCIRSQILAAVDRATGK